MCLPAIIPAENVALEMAKQVKNAEMVGLNKNFTGRNTGNGAAVKGRLTPEPAKCGMPCQLPDRKGRRNSNAEPTGGNPTSREGVSWNDKC